MRSALAATKNSMEGKCCIMKISEAAKLCDGGYVICTVEKRDEDGNAVELEIMEICETFTDALAGESILRFGWKAEGHLNL